MQAKEIIKLENVSKDYLLKNEKIEVLKNVNISFETNKLYVITGSSGAGKSTLIKMIGLIEKPTSGKIYINNEDTSNLHDDKASNIRNNLIGFIHQNYLLDENLNALENILLPTLKNKSYKEKQSLALNLMSELNIVNRKKHFPKELSGGEQQRVSIARSLINNPKIILADEPTGNLDEENASFVLKSMRTLADNGKCVIMVSHDIQSNKYADKVLVVKNKKLSELKNAK